MFQFQQLFLVILISTLTVLVVIFSIFVFRILKEVREMLHKVNKILDDMGTISGSVARPVSGLSDLLTGVKSGMKIFEVVGKIAGKRHEQDEENEDDE